MVQIHLQKSWCLARCSCLNTSFANQEMMLSQDLCQSWHSLPANACPLITSICWNTHQAYGPSKIFAIVDSFPNLAYISYIFCFFMSLLFNLYFDLKDSSKVIKSKIVYLLILDYLIYSFAGHCFSEYWNWQLLKMVAFSRHRNYKNKQSWL